MKDNYRIIMSSQDAFFSLNLTSVQKAQMLLGVSQAVASLPSNHDSARASILKCLEDSLYEESIAACADKDLLTEDHPVLRTTADPHACKPVSEGKVKNRRSVMRSVYRTVTGESNPPTREQCNELITSSLGSPSAVINSGRIWVNRSGISCCESSSGASEMGAFECPPKRARNGPPSQSSCIH